jgi:hypothetical protein
MQKMMIKKIKVALLHFLKLFLTLYSMNKWYASKNAQVCNCSIVVIIWMMHINVGKGC